MSSVFSKDFYRMAAVILKLIAIGWLQLDILKEFHCFHNFLKPCLTFYPSLCTTELIFFLGSMKDTMIYPLVSDSVGSINGPKDVG